MICDDVSPACMPSHRALPSRAAHPTWRPGPYDAAEQLSGMPAGRVATSHVCPTPGRYQAWRACGLATNTRDEGSAPVGIASRPCPRMHTPHRLCEFNALKHQTGRSGAPPGHRHLRAQLRGRVGAQAGGGPGGGARVFYCQENPVVSEVLWGMLNRLLCARCVHCCLPWARCSVNGGLTYCHTRAAAACSFM